MKLECSVLLLRKVWLLNSDWDTVIRILTLLLLVVEVVFLHPWLFPLTDTGTYNNIPNNDLVEGAIHWTYASNDFILGSTDEKCNSTSSLLRNRLLI